MICMSSTRTVAIYRRNLMGMMVWYGNIITNTPNDKVTKPPLITLFLNSFLLMTLIMLLVLVKTSKYNHIVPPHTLVRVSCLINSKSH